ncbi:MAG: peptidase T [Candidatus Kapabacteria bacterium]|nr:peptidase T [Candidatus Kapabacteria bacterium]
MKNEILERLLRYVKIDTQSDPASSNTPSTQKQFDLANLLVEELKAFGLKHVEISDKCYVYATLPSNIPTDDTAYGKVPAIGFIAHVDTSPDTTGANVNPQIIENYKGGDIVLPNDTSVVIKTAESLGLDKCIGHTIVTTDGTTLLGSDDKSGVAAIMTAVKYLLDNPQIIHGDIRIGFTPDEEIGRGANHFDVEKFNCKYAYTLDGELPGEINKETFSANACIIRAKGRDIHPGYAKDIMVNSIRAIAEVIALTPADMAPETTDGYQPYIHPHKVTGTVEHSELHLLFRDFKTEGLDTQKVMMEKIVAQVQAKHPKVILELEIVEYYRNMLELLESQPEGLDYLWEACERAGTNPYWSPIRGGTDGSRLTAMGLPTPNIYTGGQNFHSKTEWVSIDFLAKAVETVVQLSQVWYEKSKN